MSDPSDPLISLPRDGRREPAAGVRRPVGGEGLDRRLRRDVGMLGDEQRYPATPADGSLPPSVLTEAWMDVRLKRVYEPAEPADGYRVLIDRLWPRGISHARAALDEWDRELAPSAELRRWFNHEPDRFEAFRRRYVDELRQHRSRIGTLRRRARAGTVTLVYSARDTEHNDAVVLAEVLKRGLPGTVNRAGTGGGEASA